jgi:hypothetical protein
VLEVPYPNAFVVEAAPKRVVSVHSLRRLNFVPAGTGMARVSPETVTVFEPALVPVIGRINPMAGPSKISR